MHSSVRCVALLLSLSGTACGAATNSPGSDGGASSAGCSDLGGNDLSECAADPGSLRGCVVGTAWAECPGQGSPAVYCGRDGCKWLTDGKPRGSFAVPLSSTCSSKGSTCWPEAPPTMASFLYAWGDKPWSRTRTLTLQVTIDGNLTPAPAAIACTGCTGACSAPSGPCAGTPPFVTRQLPGSLVYIATPQGALAGWNLVLEVDLGLSPPRARACRTQFSDSPSCGVKEPICATDGTVTLNQSPCRSRLNDVKARFTARFPDGVVIEGTL